jgi:hypothetical protein
LLRDKGIQLTSLPESKFQGKVVQGVKAARKGRDDLELYFDKETGLLVRTRRDTAFGGLTAEKEYVFGDYKEFAGGKWPTKLQELINGNLLIDGKVESYRFPDKADESKFSRP